jgi:acetylglutamate synthase
LVRYGVAVRVHTRLGPPLDEHRVRAVLDDAFHKQLVAHYFDDLRRKPAVWVYVAGDYQGV